MKDDRLDKPVAYDTEGASLGYNFVQQSYTWAIQRLDAADSRLQHLVTLGVAVFALGAAIKSGASPPDETDSLSYSFLTGFGSFLLLLICGLIAIYRGAIRLITPRTLYDDWRDATEVEFKNEMLRHAAADYEANQESLRKKRYAELLLGVLVGVEVISLMFWILGF